MTAGSVITHEGHSVGDTRQKLIDGALEAIRAHGIAGVSARTIASRRRGQPGAGLLPLRQRGRPARARPAGRPPPNGSAHYRDRLAAVGSLRELLDLGRTLHAEERAQGNVAVLAQLLAGAQTDDRLAEPTAEALRLWVAEIESVLARLLAGSPLGEVAEPAGLARAVSAAFVGLELFEGVDPDGAPAALAPSSSWPCWSRSWRASVRWRGGRFAPACAAGPEPASSGRGRGTVGQARRRARRQACQLASTTFSCTPTVSSPAVVARGLDQHPGDRAGACEPSRMRTL